jgi:hypothetical protein
MGFIRCSGSSTTALVAVGTGCRDAARGPGRLEHRGGSRRGARRGTGADPQPQRRPDATGRVAVLVRTDAAGASTRFAAHLGVGFSVGASLGHFDKHIALTLLPAAAWTPAYQARKPRAAEHGIPDVLRAIARVLTWRPGYPRQHRRDL